MAFSRRLPWLTIAALWLTVSGALAQPRADEVSVAEREQARGLMDLGRQRAAAGDHTAALEAYQGAHAIMGVATTGLAVGEELVALGRLIEARDHLLRIAREEPQSDELPPIVEARERAKVLARELSTRIPSVRVEVIMDDGRPLPNDLDVTLDGQRLDRKQQGLPQFRDPGKVELRGEAFGYKTVNRSVDLAESEHHVVALVLRRIKPGSTESAESGTDPLIVVAWVGFGLAIAGSISGAATGAAALSKSSALHDDCPSNVCPPDKGDSVDSMTLFAHVSTGSFAVAGAGLVLGIVSIAVAQARAPREQAQVVVAPTGLAIHF